MIKNGLDYKFNVEKKNIAHYFKGTIWYAKAIDIDDNSANEGSLVRKKKESRF